MTDEFMAYNGLVKIHPGGLESVNHGAGEYSRMTESGIAAYTNTEESFFAILKRIHSLADSATK